MCILFIAFDTAQLLEILVSIGLSKYLIEPFKSYFVYLLEGEVSYGMPYGTVVGL